MAQPTPTVLLTRPLAQSEAFAAALRGAISPDLPILISPVLEIVPRAIPVRPGDYGFLVLTSANALAALGDGRDWRGMTAYCVGRRTAERAAALGLSAVSADGDAADLVARVRNDAPAGRALYLRGEHAAFDVAESLNSAGIETDEHVAYDQKATPLSGPAKTLLSGSGPVILPLFSVRSARLLSKAATGMVARSVVVAMSPAVADAWTASEGPVRTAKAPDGPSMMAEISAAFYG